MIKTNIVSKLKNLSRGHLDRIMSMRLPSRNKNYATLFSVYSPTHQAKPAVKDKFYTDLRNLVKNVPTNDKIIILGDLNARVGTNVEAWKGVLGNHGLGNCNGNGLRLLEF